MMSTPSFIARVTYPFMSVSIQAQFAEAQREIREYLPAESTLTDAERRRILRRYAAAISGNFISWMAAAITCCRSVEGRYAAEENVRVEVAENHPGMLRNFVLGSGAVPAPDDYAYVDCYVTDVQREVSQMSGLFLTCLLGILENTSAEFIPWLAAISKSLGNQDFQYTDVHGLADVGHAEQFRWALEKESALYPNAESEIAQAISIAVKFLKGILSPAG